MLIHPRQKNYGLYYSGSRANSRLDRIKTLIFAFLTLITCLSTNYSLAQQNISPEEFKTAFIFHLLDKVEWKDESSFDEFKIGIVGNEPELLTQLQRSSNQKTVKNKSISVSAVNSIPQMKGFHLLFIAESVNTPLRRIVAATSRTNRLLVTENTKDKTNTMINLLSHRDGTYTFEVNKANITFEYLKLNPDILLLGGTEMDVAELLKESSNQLESLKQELNQQSAALEESKQRMLQYQQQYENAVTESERIKQQMQKQAQLLDEKNRLIEAKNVSIREKEGELLAIQTELSQASDSLKSNEAILGEKLNTIASKEKEVTTLSELIAKNQEILTRQQASITEQKLQLSKQQKSLALQGTQIEKQQSWLMYGAVLLVVFTIFLMVISYLNKERRKTNLELIEKNLALSEVQSELLIARDQAQAANEAKSSFLANMSHEIRTPMNAIIGMLHLMKQTMLNIKQADYITKIDTAANSLLQIINDILDFSKVEAGELHMEEVEFNLSKVLDDLANLTGLKIQQKGLEFIYDIDPKIPEKIIGDPLRLGQVLINLTNNAMKFTEEGEVRVKVKIAEQLEHSIELEFAVVDTGIGMTKEVYQRLFKPFSQADTSTTRKFGGTGLGLAISKRLVEQMDGTISVVSKPNVGSRFSFRSRFGYLPSQSVFDTISDSTKFSELHILIVAENLTAQRSLQRILKSFHCRTSTAADINSCMDSINSAKKLNRDFDIILFDYKIALANQQELIQIHQNTSSKVSLMLSHVTDEEERLIHKVKPDMTVKKPVTPSSMLDALMPIVDGDNKPYRSKFVRFERRERKHHLTAALKQARILIVEDNEINQEVAREILSSSVGEIDLANDGKQAVEMVNNKFYDCVLMDIQMPVMDGYQAAEAIRKKYAYDDLPIIAMTANAMDGDKEKCLEAGMNDYVSKPIRIKSFFDTLNKWFAGDEEIIQQEQNIPLDHNISRQATTQQGFNDLIDMSSGIELMGDASSFIELLEQFKLQQADFILNSRSALANNNLSELAKSAHNLKGVSGNLFIHEVPDLADKLNQACHTKDSAKAATYITLLETVLSNVMAQIDSLHKDYAHEEIKT